METRLLKIIFIICGFIVHNNIYCQWNESELFGNLKNIIFLNNNTGIIIGSHGEIYLTNDQGNSWEDRSLPVEKMISNGQFINDTTIYITTKDTIDNFWISRELGNNWEVSSYFKSGISDLYFFNDSIGIISSENAIYKINIISYKIDTLWTIENDSSIKYCYFNSILFFNDSIGFANGTLFKAVNKSTKIFGIIIKTNDQGRNWQYFYNSDSILFMNNEGLFIRNNRIYAYEGLNLIYTDIDTNELFWNKIEIPNNLGYTGGKDGITSVFFTSLDTGYITISPIAILWPPNGNGFDKILKTFDSGISWHCQLIDTFDLAETYANPSLSDILFINDSIGVACGYNKVFKTMNRGGGIISVLKKINHDNYFKIFQNKNQLIIELNQIPEKLDIYVYDLNGRLKKIIYYSNAFLTRYFIDLNLIKDGFYIAEIIVDDKIKITKKLILSHNQ